MKTPLATPRPHSGKATGNENISKVHYSGNEFFYEGQENRADKEESTSVNKEKTGAKGKKRDRFFGDFNMFF